MKIIFDNIKSNYIAKIAFIIFVVKCIFSFYNSIKLDSVDLLISEVIEYLYQFLILYTLGLILTKDGS